MKEYGFYHPDNGYWQAISYPNAEILASYPEGTIEVPVQPSGLHKFDGTDWVPPTQAELDAAKSQEIRYQRDIKLATEVDPIAGNALRWAALTADKQAAWAAYRQALLDISKQVGFPNDVMWPTKPL